MNYGHNGRYLLKPEEAVNVTEAQNKYIHLGDIYITNIFPNSYYTSNINIKMHDLFTGDNCDFIIRISNDTKNYTIYINKSGEYLQPSKIFCVCTTNISKVSYKISIYLFNPYKEQFNINYFYYDISKWAEFKKDNNFTVVENLPDSVINFTKNVTSGKIFNIDTSGTERFKARKDINKIDLSGSTVKQNQTNFSNIDVLWKNYQPNEDVYFVNPIHDDTNDIWYLGTFFFQKDTNYIKLLTSTIPNGIGPIDYTIYWNISYYTNLRFQ